MSDLANVAAATAPAVGYAYENWFSQAENLFYSRLTKGTKGATNEDEDYMEATASGITQAAADANTVSALNAQRSARYGFQEPATPSLDEENVVEVVDGT